MYYIFLYASMLLAWHSAYKHAPQFRESESEGEAVDEGCVGEGVAREWIESAVK